MEFAEINRKFEQKYLPRVVAALRPDELIAVIEQSGLHAGMNYLTTGYQNKGLPELIEGLYLEVGLRHARMNYRRMQQDIKKRMGINETWQRQIIDYLRRFLIEKITFDVAETTRDYLLKVFSKGIEEGLSYTDMVNQLKELPFTRYQAARIVRTEVGRAANVGHKAQVSTFDYEMVKTWVAARDHRTRGVNPKDHASHIKLHGTVIDENELFTDPINGDKMEFPGDIHASAASTINCRCRVVYEGKRDINNQLIPKRKTIGNAIQRV